MKPRGPVHYVAHGTTALAFDCYYEEMRAHVARSKEVDNVRRAYFQTKGWVDERGVGLSTERFRVGPVPGQPQNVPPPRRHTALNRVTCRACWRAIADMARQRGIR